MMRRVNRVWMLTGLAVATAWSAVAAGPRQSVSVAERIAAVSAPGGAGAAGRPVSVHGVCTGIDLDSGDFFIQDATAGIRIRARASLSGVVPGDGVDVVGTLERGPYAPAIRASSVSVRAKEPLPSGVADLDLGVGTGYRDGQWVASRGVVRARHDSADRVTLAVAVRNRVVNIVVPRGQSAALPNHIVDASLAFQGLCVARFNAVGELAGASIFIPDGRLLQAAEAVPAELMAQPVLRLADVGQYAGPAASHRPVHVRGSVAFFRPGVAIFLTDGTASLYVQTTSERPLVAGDIVDVVGVPDYDAGSPTLSDAAFELRGKGAPPVAVPVSGAALVNRRLDAALVRVEATLIQSSFAGGVATLGLESQGLAFEALLESDEWPAAIAALQPGSVLELVGVCILLRDAHGNPSGARLRLRNVDDAHLAHGPSWWTPKVTASVAAAFGVLSVIILVWTVALKRQVRHQTTVIRERLERELVLGEQLRQSQKMQAMGQLAGGVAHDFNNILTVINGRSSMVLADMPARDRYRADIEEIKDAGSRAALLTSQLLAFSRKQVTEPRIVNLNDIVKGATKILRRLIGEDIELEIALAAAQGTISADPGQIQQVIVNLTVNARDAMPDGGRLLIGTRTVDATDGEIRQRDGQPADAYVVLTARDTGVGIDEATQARVFEPFFTTKEPGKGTGLGLSTVYGIVTQAGGFVRVNSEKGRGAEFQVFWPMAEAPVEECRESVGDARRWHGRETVLLAEDDAAVRALVCRGMRDRGYQVLEFADGARALRGAREHGGAIDLLLTDVVMPALNGAELSRLLTAERPLMKTLFVSGYAEKGVVGLNLADPRVAFLQKPFDMDALGRAARMLLDRAQEPRPAGLTASGAPGG